MTSSEILVVIVGAVGGYFLVKYFLEFNNSSKPSQAYERKGSHQQEPPKYDSSSTKTHFNEEEIIRMSWFRILETAETSTKEEISAAYKKIIRQYHPDKVAQMGIEIREIAEFKSKQINAAYEYAMNLRK